MFDQPGTGQARFRPEDGLDVSALAGLTHAFAERLIARPYVVAGASMGGLITLLQMRRHGADRIRAHVNSEGNLLGEDCMFSRRAIPHSLDEFSRRVFVEPDSGHFLFYDNPVATYSAVGAFLDEVAH